MDNRISRKIEMSANGLSNAQIDSISYVSADVEYVSRNEISYKTVQSNRRSENNSRISSRSSTESMGNFLYKVPDTMIVLNSYTIIARISKKLDTLIIEENINGKFTKEVIRIESRMEVDIIDRNGDNFIINKINSKRQIVEDGYYTEWIFNVTPLKYGELPLDIVVTIVRGDDIKEDVYTDLIIVKSNPVKQVEKWWNNHWIVLSELVIIPIIIWLFNLWRKRKGSN